MNTRTTHGLYPPKARTGDRAGGCAVAIPEQTSVFVYLPVGLPAASVAGLFLKPLSARCCQCIRRPSYTDGVCYPEGCTPDSIAPSAARAGRLRLQDASAQMPRVARKGGTPTNRQAALDLHRRAA